MKKLMENKPILHAVLWIIIYILTVNIGDALSEITGTSASILTAVMLIALSLILILYLKKNRKFDSYGIKGITKFDLRKSLFYIPLILIILIQYIGGIHSTLSTVEIISACILMIGVGFIEELVFRGFLFQGIKVKSGVNRAILISGITFGTGHIVNLLRGYTNKEQAGQIIVAIAIGIALALLVAITKSIVPGMLFHIIFNIGGTITKQDASQQLNIIFLFVIISILYSIYLYRFLYKKGERAQCAEGIVVK